MNQNNTLIIPKLGERWLYEYDDGNQCSNLILECNGEIIKEYPKDQYLRFTIVQILSSSCENVGDKFDVDCLEDYNTVWTKLENQNKL